jgi:hypothetical protein
MRTGISPGTLSAALHGLKHAMFRGFIFVLKKKKKKVMKKHAIDAYVRAVTG